jgi:hypothetical protein
MEHERIKRELAQAEMAVARATSNVARQRQILHYSRRLRAPELIALATTLLRKVEDNLLLKMEIRDKLKRALAAAIEADRSSAD